jgi:NAD(P)-dependent dehydrogenase (short-subunit alcohol dehydrogenase family)
MEFEMENLANRVAVVTGAASGIGFALARRLLDASMKVVIADVEAPALEKARAALEAHGEVEVEAVICDVADSDSMARLAQATLDRFGSVHLVCSNAGVESGGKVEDITPAQWDWVMDVNLGGALNACRTFLPIMRAQGHGHLVATASLAGLAGAVPAAAPYGISKSAVITLCETLDAELRLEESDLSVSAILLGNVRDTRMGEAGRNRPGQVTPPTDSPLLQHALAATKSRMAGAITPDEAAERICQGIAARRLYIVTHPDTTTKVMGLRRDAILRDVEAAEATLSAPA